MSTTRPWYKRYPAHFLAGTYRLTAEEKGVYSTLLDLMYDRGGPLVDDARELARICGCSTRRFNTIKNDLAHKHGKILLRDGLVINERALEQIGVDIPEENGDLSGGKVPDKSALNRPDPNKNNDLTRAIDMERDITPPTPPSGVSETEWREFEQKWGTSDARVPGVCDAFSALAPPERAAAIAGIAEFRAEEDRLKRGKLGARRYLVERRWGSPARLFSGHSIDPTWPNWKPWKAAFEAEGGSFMLRQMRRREDGWADTHVTVLVDWPPDYTPTEAELAALAVCKAGAMPKRKIA